VESATSQALIQQHKEIIQTQKVNVGQSRCGSLQEHLPSIAQVEEQEVAIREWLRIQDRDFFREGIFALVSSGKNPREVLLKDIALQWNK
jgi:hypothetical protein